MHQAPLRLLSPAQQRSLLDRDNRLPGTEPSSRIFITGRGWESLRSRSRLSPSLSSPRRLRAPCSSPRAACPVPQRPTPIASFPPRGWGRPSLPTLPFPGTPAEAGWAPARHARDSEDRGPWVAKGGFSTSPSFSPNTSGLKELGLGRRDLWATSWIGQQWLSGGPGGKSACPQLGFSACYLQLDRVC